MLLPFDEVFGGTVGTFLGAWLGAVPIPLDWYVASSCCCSSDFYEYYEMVEANHKSQGIVSGKSGLSQS